MISVRPTVFQDAPILHAIQKQALKSAAKAHNKISPALTAYTNRN